MALSKYLENVPEDKIFNLTDGKLVHNLEELYSMMNESGPEVFYSHVNDVANDVATWTRNNVGYNELADKMLAITDRDEFLKLLDDNINELKKPAPIAPVSLPTPAPAPVNISAPFPPSGNETAQNPIIQNSAPAMVVAPILNSAPIQSAIPISNPVLVPNIASVPAQVAPQAAQNISVASPETIVVNVVNPSAATSVPAISEQKIDSITATMSFMAEDRFDFEDIFNMLLYELEQEVLVLDS